jgi:hypothetical protein
MQFVVLVKGEVKVELSKILFGLGRAREADKTYSLAGSVPCNGGTGSSGAGALGFPGARRLFGFYSLLHKTEIFHESSSGNFR